LWHVTTYASVLVGIASSLPPIGAGPVGAYTHRLVSAREPLFSARFFVMCAFSFNVFLSAFMLLPTAPYRILALGGSETSAGMFLGFLTYASAFSAPLTGTLADRLGKRRMLIACSLVIALFSLAYALTTRYVLLLAIVPVHGVFWSGLLSASAAYMTDLLPASRRAEGIGYWGLSTILAIAIAPGFGFAVYRLGWAPLCGVTLLLNLSMTAIAWNLEDRRPTAAERATAKGSFVEWRVVLLSFSLFLYSFGYGGITSFVALYSEANGVAPKSLYFTVLAVVIGVTRPISGPLADRVGHRKVFLPCLVLIVIGLGLLAAGGTLPWLLASALVFGSGFGAAYPVFAAHVMHHVGAERRGAAFGGILAAFDTGIGTGSILSGFLIQRYSYRAAFLVATLLASLSIPYFVYSERRFLRSAAGPSA
jgi:MFS family permease